MAIIKFYGDLKQFGDKFRVEADNAAEALRCLLLQIPNLKQHMIDDFYRVRINRTDMNEDDIQFGLQSSLPDNAVIHIVPRAMGAKSGGLFSFIAGAVMVVAGFVTGIATPWGAGLMSAGIGMMIGGVAQMLTKMPSTDTSDAGKNNNTSFSNLDNTIAQGSPVPLCYGKMMIGSKVLSQSIETF